MADAVNRRTSTDGTRGMHQEWQLMIGRASEILREDGVEQLVRSSGEFLKNTGKRKLRSHYVRRRFGTADLFKCGYPKSGNNWVHFLMANTMVKAADREDDIHFRNKQHWLATDVPRRPPVEGFPRMLSNTDFYDEQPYVDADTKVIYTIRHPADVMESFYDYQTNYWEKDVGTFSEFIRSDEYGIPAWRRHVEGWEGNFHLLVRFEDLKADPLAELRRIAALWDHEISEETLKYAVDQSSFENMRQMEDEYGKIDKEGANMDHRFMRRGESDKGKKVVTRAGFRYIRGEAGEILTRYDYEVPV